VTQATGKEKKLKMEILRTLHEKDNIAAGRDRGGTKEQMAAKQDEKR